MATRPSAEKSEKKWFMREKQKGGGWVKDFVVHPEFECMRGGGELEPASSAVSVVTQRNVNVMCRCGQIES